jgi:hypothetical protein
MNDTRVALLIDADNLSGDVIEQAIEHLLKLHGAIHFRRAYCSPQKVVEHIDLFRRHSIRPMVNVPTGKNSTDIALAVDAIDLAITECPDVVVIASSDSDYAPLAQRLREKGCRVLGIGQAGKTGGESPLAYDEFIDLAHRKARATPRGVAVAGPRAAPVAASRAAPVAAPARTRAQPVRARAPASAPAAPPPAPALPPEVASILHAVPALRSGAAIQLNEVGEALRHHELLKSKSASPSRFLKRHAAHFELAPSDKPRTVRYLGVRTA